MHATRNHGATLAGRQPDTGMDPRLALRRRRNAFVDVWGDAPRKPDLIYDLTRTDPRCALPDEKQRTMLHDAIRARQTTPERIVRYRLFQLIDDLAQFPEHSDALELTFVRLVREEAEAVEAQAVARALPTPANCSEALTRTREAIAIEQLACALLESGEFGRPMGGPQ